MPLYYFQFNVNLILKGFASQTMNFSSEHPRHKEVFEATRVIRKPISGIVSGYHELPYIMISPDDQNESACLKINGKINVSPRFIISAQALSETFGEVFDPETFDKQLEGRFFSFAAAQKKNMKVQSEYFRLEKIDEHADTYIEAVNDSLMSQENIKTGLIYGPQFRLYPVSIDRFINEIIDREFNV